MGYSAFSGGQLQKYLQGRQVDTLIISGGETDVCVLATVLAAVDRGYRVIIVEDALCSSSDQTHDALLRFMRNVSISRSKSARRTISSNIGIPPEDVFLQVAGR
jgi:nicotinamidase-related amidase